MSHLVIYPVLLPLFAGVVLLLGAGWPLAWQRAGLIRCFLPAVQAAFRSYVGALLPCCRRHGLSKGIFSAALGRGWRLMRRGVMGRSSRE